MFSESICFLFVNSFRLFFFFLFLFWCFGICFLLLVFFVVFRRCSFVCCRSTIFNRLIIGHFFLHFYIFFLFIHRLGLFFFDRQCFLRFRTSFIMLPKAIFKT